jgi:hypothetical protein
VGDERIEIASIVGFMTGEPLVQLRWTDGTDARTVQFSCAEAIALAMQIHEAAAAALMDTFLVEFVADRLGRGPQHGAVLLKEFREWREAREQEAS